MTKSMTQKIQTMSNDLVFEDGDDRYVWDNPDYLKDMAFKDCLAHVRVRTKIELETAPKVSVSWDYCVVTSYHVIIETRTRR